MNPRTLDNLDVLFVSELPLFPLDQGFKVHGYHMARALQNRHLRIAMTSLRPTCAPDLPVPLAKMLLPWPDATPDDLAQLHRHWRGPLAPLRHKLAVRQALNLSELAGLLALVRTHRPRAVVAVGSHGPAFLRTLRGLGPATIWYAADDPAWFHLTRLPHLPFTQWRGALSAATLWGVFERAFAHNLHAAIGVSRLDTLLLHRIAGVRRAMTIRNGVDLDYYQPNSAITPSGHTLVFWGRLDFEPNIDAVVWFATQILPKLLERMPEVTFQILGKNPAPAVTQLASLPGVQLLGPVPDIRPFAHRAAAVVLPMRVGGGIKNKLLEAAALAKPIAATPLAVRGLPDHTAVTPAAVCRSAKQWVDTLTRLLNNADLAAEQGLAARRWAQSNHTWDAAAQQFITLLDKIAPAPLASVRPRAQGATVCTAA